MINHSFNNNVDLKQVNSLVIIFDSICHPSAIFSPYESIFERKKNDRFENMKMSSKIIPEYTKYEKILCQISVCF